MENAKIIDFSKYQDSRNQISEQREFEKYLKLLSLHDLISESNRLISRLNEEKLDERLISRCRTVIKEINYRMGGQVSDLNLAFSQMFQKTANRLNELKAFQEN